MSSDVGNQNEMAVGNHHAISSIEKDEEEAQENQHEADSQHESGVEQYESSDGLQADPARSSPNTIVPPPAQLPFSSILQQSSLTKDDATLLQRSQRSAGAVGITSAKASETKDSMAFHTIQPVNLDASLNEDSNLMDMDHHQE